MRKTYSKEFKLEIVRKIANNLTTVGQVAKEYHISRPIVSRWVAEFNRYGNHAFRGHGNQLPDKAAQALLEKEIKQLKEENEILKKFEVFVKQASK